MIGVPNQKVGLATIAGAVHVLFGSVSGPTGTGSQFWNQDVAGVADVAEPEQGEVGERFGWALAIGNFGNSVDLDLAIGVPGESTGRPSVMGAGAVNVLYGSPSGPSTVGNQVWSQGTSGVLGTPAGGEAPTVGDSFGSTLAAGDFGGGPQADLAVAAPYDDESGAVNAGVVNVLPGSASGLSATGDQFWSQATSGIAGTPGSNDAFGEALATADLGHDAHADLAIGVPADSVSTGGGSVSGGAVNVVYGTATGLTTAGSQLWDQGPLPGGPENFDRFGQSLSAANYGNGATADLAVGVPDEDTGGLLSTGVAHVVYGTAAGLSTAGTQLWDQNSPGSPAPPRKTIDSALPRPSRRGSADIGSGDREGSLHLRVDLAVEVVGTRIEIDLRLLVRTRRQVDVHVGVVDRERVLERVLVGDLDRLAARH